MKDKYSLYLLILLSITLIITLLAYQTGYLTSDRSGMSAVAINKQHTIVSASDDNLLLWNGIRCTAIWPTHYIWTSKSVNFSHTGNLIVSGGESVKIWSDHKELTALRGHTAGIKKVVFDESDKYVISNGYDNLLIIWDWKKQQALKRIMVKVPGFSINQNNILAYVDSSGYLKLFDINTLSEIRSLGLHSGVPLFYPDGKMIVVKSDDELFTAIDAAGKMVDSLRMSPDEYYLDICKFTPDGQYLIRGGDDVEIWDWKSKTKARTLDVGCNDFTFSDNDELLVASGDGTIKIYNYRSGEHKMSIGTRLVLTGLAFLLSVIICLLLVCGYQGIYKSAENKYASFNILLILSIWSVGILGLLFLIKKYLIGSATVVSWITTLISMFLALTFYGMPLVLLVMPFSLFFGYLQIMYDREKAGAYMPVIINLFLFIVLSFFLLKGIS